MQRTIGTIADDILGIAIRVKELDGQIAVLKAESEVYEKELELAAEKEGLTAGKGVNSSWKVEPVTVPQVTDWDAFYDYMSLNKYYHLLQKRPAVKACRELWDQGTVIPGTEKFTQNKVKVQGV